jgi:putative ABC transport system permease protein
MTLPLIVYRSLRQHAVSTAVSALAIALAGGLLMAVWVLKEEASRTFTSVNAGFDAVLGPRSSKLQLVLNSLFHLDESPGTLPAREVDAIRANPNVELALPIAVGDNYRGFRLVGTTMDLFDKVRYAPQRGFRILPPGRPFQPGRHQAVVGSFAAERLGLRVGDTFHPFHGLLYNEEQEHAETFEVTGVFAPTNTPADRVIWIPLEGLQQMSGHNPKTATDVSAVLVKLEDAAAGFQMDMLYNKRGKVLTFAWPIGAILAKLFDTIAWVDRVLTFIAYLVVVVATASILASIYNSLNERRREIAILRALGARRSTVFLSIVLEAASIAALGMLVGYGVYAAIVATASSIIRAQTGVVLDPLQFYPIMLLAPAGIVALAGLIGVFPALKAYRVDVATGLAPAS